MTFSMPSPCSLLAARAPLPATRRNFLRLAPVPVMRLIAMGLGSGRTPMTARALKAEARGRGSVAQTMAGAARGAAAHATGRDR